MASKRCQTNEFALNVSKYKIATLSSASELLLTLGRRLTNRTLHSDLTLTCRGHKFPVHKFVLGAQSEYFYKLINGSFKVSNIH